jgi:predicted DNA-binding protein YlxM (UPF0122 family)
MVDKPSKEELYRLYWKQGLSCEEIAEKYNVHKEAVRQWMVKHKIPRRTYSEAMLVKNSSTPASNSVEPYDTLKAVIDDLKDVPPVRYDPEPREDIYVPLPLKSLEFSKKLEATLTLVLSDLHLGHENHLPETYWSTISNLLRILKALKKKLLLRDLE